MCSLLLSRLKQLGRFYLLGKIAQEMMPCLHSTSLKCLGMVYRCSKGKSSSQDTMVSLRGGRPLTYSCSPEAKGLSLSSDPPSHLTSIKPWCYHHHLRVAYKQQAVVHSSVFRSWLCGQSRCVQGNILATFFFVSLEGEYFCTLVSGTCFALLISSFLWSL